MKNNFLARWLAFICILLLSGCSHSSIKPGKAAVTLPDPYIASVHILYSETALQGKMERSSSGEIRLAVDSPENLSGLTLQLREGMLQAEYAGMQVAVHSAAAPAAAVLGLLQNALNTVCTETLRLNECSVSRPLQLETENGRLEVLLEEENFLPRKITIPDLDFTAELSAFSSEDESRKSGKKAANG